MYSRAGLSRTVTLVVALSLTAASAGAVARPLDAAGTRSAIDLGCSHVATIGSDIPVSLEPWRLADLALYDSAAGSIAGGVRFEAAMAGNRAPAQHDAAAARRIEQIRKVE